MIGPMLKGFTHARLACGCRITFREGVEGSPVTVVVDTKGASCTLPLHVRDVVMSALVRRGLLTVRLPPVDAMFEADPA